MVQGHSRLICTLLREWGQTITRVRFQHKKVRKQCQLI
uniref:Uncharacterized protein n=1 Tax=Rhizophora mucronata TaxID=61149 RepID=A0A2P2IXN0_RHIMU